MTETISITQTTEGNVIVLHLTGRLDGQTEGILAQHAQQVHTAGNRQVLLDLSKLEMLTSAGLRTIHNLYKLFSPKSEIENWHMAHPDEPYKSPYFKLAGATPEIYYILNIAGFLHNIPLFANLQDGLNSFNS
jgi:ABC-type transporter Mla MlaB component